MSDSVVEDWQKQLPDICRNYAPEDIFNGDETDLFFRSLPCRSVVEKGDSCNMCKGGKQVKERITVLCVPAQWVKS